MGLVPSILLYLQSKIKSQKCWSCQWFKIVCHIDGFILFIWNNFIISSSCWSEWRWKYACGLILKLALVVIRCTLSYQNFISTSWLFPRNMLQWGSKRSQTHPPTHLYLCIHIFVHTYMCRKREQHQHPHRQVAMNQNVYSTVIWIDNFGLFRAKIVLG